MLQSSPEEDENTGTKPQKKPQKKPVHIISSSSEAENDSNQKIVVKEMDRQSIDRMLEEHGLQMAAKRQAAQYEKKSREFWKDLSDSDNAEQEDEPIPNSGHERQSPQIDNLQVNENDGVLAEADEFLGGHEDQDSDPDETFNTPEDLPSASISEQGPAKSSDEELSDSKFKTPPTRGTRTRAVTTPHRFRPTPTPSPRPARKSRPSKNK